MKHYILALVLAMASINAAIYGAQNETYIED